MTSCDATKLDTDQDTLRAIRHGGPRNSNRFQFARTDVRRVQTVLPAGKSVAESVADLMRREACASGIIELSGGRLDPFEFVIPAQSPTAEHAVWYSETRFCPSGVTIEKASCSVGLREGDYSLHCHGLWRSAAGELVGGHMWPDRNKIVEPIPVTALLASSARFVRRLDEETNFELFAIEGAGSGEGAIATVRPNEDIIESLERVAEAAGIREARIHGIGSLIDMRLTDGQLAKSLALEVAITGGRIVPHEGGVTVVELSMAGVGMDGVPYEGVLQRGCNRVCVTFELALDPEAA